MIQANEQLSRLVPLNAGKISFATKATLKGLRLLQGILRELIAIREELRCMNVLQASHGQPLTPEEAAKVLQISATKLQGMKDNGVLVEGIHYWQDDGILRYSPEIGKRFIEQSMKRPEKNKKSGTTKQTKSKQADKKQTRNAFKEKK